jgi:TolA-binding protein
MKRILIFVVLGVLGAVAARADILQTRTGAFTGEVTRVEGSTVFIKSEKGEFGISTADVVRVDVLEPSDYQVGLAALKAGKTADAVSVLKPLMARFAGLPATWVINSMVHLGDAYLEQKEFAGAESIFDQMKKVYPNASQTQALPLKKARILIGNKKYDEAMKMVDAYLDVQLKKEYLPVELEAGVAEALVLKGDCLLAAGKAYPALDSYLKVVTLYNYDDLREAEARFKAAKILEQEKNWKRARESYDDLVKAMPDSRYVAEAKQRSKAIAEAHPE